MNVFEAMSLLNDWEWIKAGRMDKNEVVSLVTHFATVALSGAGVHAYVAGSDVGTLGAAAGVVAGILYQAYTSRKLLKTPVPK